jgi:F-type H+-transporting ATPase subunit delta
VASEDGPVSGIAERYAGALYDLASERKALDQVAEDLRSFRAMLKESEDLRRLLRSPMIGREEQARALMAVLEKAGVSALTRNFVGVVARNRRLFALSGMAEVFLRILAERRGEVTVDVTSAQPLNTEQMDTLQETLRRIVGGRVAVNTTVDPSLLGGLVVKIGSRLFDSSIRTKLQRLQHALRGA